MPSNHPRSNSQVLRTLGQSRHRQCEHAERGDEVFLRVGEGDSLAVVAVAHVDGFGCTADGDRLDAGVRVDRLHHRLVAVERATSHGNREVIVVRGEYERLKMIARRVADDDVVGGESFREPAGFAVETRELRGIRRRHLHELFVREHGRKLLIVPDGGVAHFLEHAVAAGRRPVGRDRERHVFLGGRDVGGRAVQLDVAARRPDEADAVLAELREVFVLERNAVNDDEAFGEEAVRACHAQLARGAGVDAFAKMRDDGLVGGQRVAHALLVALFQLERKNAVLQRLFGRFGAEEAGVVIEIARESFRANERKAADRARRAPHQRLHLGEALEIASGVAQLRLIAAQSGGVAVRRLPLVAVPGERAGGPARKRVPRQVIVEIDEARIDEAVRLDDVDIVRHGHVRARVFDDAVFHEHDTVLDHLVGRDERAAQRVRLSQGSRGKEKNGEQGSHASSSQKHRPLSPIRSGAAAASAAVFRESPAPEAGAAPPRDGEEIPVILSRRSATKDLKIRRACKFFGDPCRSGVSPFDVSVEGEKTMNTKLTLQRIGAVLAGLLAIFVLTTAVDIVLHATGVYPPWSEPIGDGLSALVTAYRIVISVAGCYIAARLAPDNPMRHALVLGGIGVALSLAGAIATWNARLGPQWYPLALVAVALPCAWAGGLLNVIEQHVNAF